MPTRPATRQNRRRQWAANLRKHVGNRSVREFRDELAQHGADVALASVYDWLRGDTSPTPEHQAVIGQVLDVEPRDIFTIEVG